LDDLLPKTPYQFKIEKSGQFMTGWSLTIAMKKSKFTESQIVFALQQAESGVTVAEVYSDEILAWTKGRKNAWCDEELLLIDSHLVVHCRRPWLHFLRHGSSSRPERAETQIRQEVYDGRYGRPTGEKDFADRFTK
jgi:hypothetical protein